MIVLGIETSCDETAAAVVERHPDGGGRILSDIILSQISDHLAFGGVVPEIAARAHVEALDGVIAAAMREAGVGFGGLDGVAATAGPGLIGGVIVGLTTAKAIALAAGIKLAAVNHLEGHALTARLTDDLAFPYLLLLVSGGHTQFVAVEGVGRYVGSAPPSTMPSARPSTRPPSSSASPIPAGPPIEAAAERGDGRRFALPRPLIGKPGADFSLSGLKTALRLAAEKVAPLSDADVDDLAASFQAAVVDIVRDRAAHAMDLFARAHGPGRDGAGSALVIAGGVAANQAIRTALAAEAVGHDFRLVAPPARLCADNGVMIAWAGAERLALGLSDPLDAPARARWPLTELAVGEAAA